MADKESLISEIERLRKERNAIILAHNYVSADIQQIADFCGDSLELSIKASKCDADVIRLCACGAGTREGAQHSQFLESWFAHLPGFVVVFPSNAADGKGLMKSAIRSDLPVVFVESRHVYYEIQDVPDGEYIVPIGKAAVLRPGEQVTLVSYGYACEKALQAAELVKEKVDVEVIDLRTIKPLDMETVYKSVEKTGRLIVAHDAPANCSVGAEVIRRTVAERFDYLDAPPVVAASKDVPIPFNDELEDYTVLSVQDIVDKIMEISVGII